MTTERRDTTAKGRAVRQIIEDEQRDGLMVPSPGYSGRWAEVPISEIASLLARAFALGEAHGIEKTTAETLALLPKEGGT